MPLTIGKYKLLRRIAIGGMAEIYLAAVQGEAGFERKVIIKKILPLYARETEFVRRLVDEGLLASRLQHGNIVQVIDLGKIGPDYFIAMEFVDGIDLRNLLHTAIDKQFAIPIPIGLHVLWQAARGLGYAHGKRSNRDEPLNIVHRDISPANIFISWEGAVKLGDFGIAKANQRLTKGTMAGVLHGKFPYMSPEQAEGQSLDQRSDIFSFGVVAYELLTYRRPFEGESDLQVLARVQEGIHIPILEARPELPPECEKIVATCLKKDPAQRYANGVELERSLARLMQQKGWVVSEGDVADFCTNLYGDEKRSLAAEVDATAERDAQVVEASPLDPYDLRAGLPDPVLIDRSKLQRHEVTRAVTSPAWKKTRQKRSALWLVWTGLMVFLAAALLLDYFALHFLLGKGQGPRTPATSSDVLTQPHDMPGTTPPGLDVVSPRPPDVRQAPDIQGGTGSVRQELPSGLDAVALVPTDISSPSRRTSDATTAADANPAKTATDGGAEIAADDASADQKHAGTNQAVRASSWVRLTVVPPEAQIYVDGDLLGVQPQRIVCYQGSGAKRIRLEAEGHEPAEFFLEHPTPRKVAKRLRKLETGRLRLRYYPAVAVVLVDGKTATPSGKLNFIEMELPVGEHLVVVRHEGHEASETIVIRSDREWKGTITAGQ